MNITFSRTLARRVAREIQRAIGSHPSISFYTGPVPKTADEPPGHRLQYRLLEQNEVEELQQTENLPELPPAATYWRLADASGVTLMQGSRGNGNGTQ